MAAEEVGGEGISSARPLFVVTSRVQLAKGGEPSPRAYVAMFDYLVSVVRANGPEPNSGNEID